MSCCLNTLHTASSFIIPLLEEYHTTIIRGRLAKTFVKTVSMSGLLLGQVTSYYN